jgi:hypothetical protein
MRRWWSFECVYARHHHPVTRSTDASTQKQTGVRSTAIGEEEEEEEEEEGKTNALRFATELDLFDFANAQVSQQQCKLKYNC